MQCFQQCGRYSEALRHGASEDELALIDRLIKQVLKANAKEDEDIITFQTQGFAQQKEWRGQLGRRVAVFVEKMSREVVVAHKAEVSIEPHGKVLLGKTLKAKVKIRDHKWQALISPKAFERFLDWKLGEDVGENDRADETDARDPETGIRAKDQREEESPTGIKRRPRPEDDD